MTEHKIDPTPAWQTHIGRIVLSRITEKRRVDTFTLLEGNEADTESVFTHYEIHICLEMKQPRISL